MVIRDACPACGSNQCKKNGHIHTGKQNHQCKTCGRQFVLDAENRVIAEDQRTLVERLLLEKIFLHGICRADHTSLQDGEARHLSPAWDNVAMTCMLDVHNDVHNAGVSAAVTVCHHVAKRVVTVCRCGPCNTPPQIRARRLPRMA